MCSEAAAMVYKSAQILPFDEEATSNAMWSFLDVRKMPQKVLRIVRRSQDTHVVKSRFMLRLDQDSYLLAHTDSVMKRYIILEDRVMLGESSTSWSAYRGDSQLWSHQSRESVWFVIRKYLLSAKASKSQQVGCHFTAHIRSEAEASGTAPSLHSVVMPFFRDVMDSHRQILENWLWDSMRGKGSLQHK
ncbi:hypothetical protein PInf_018468 [Phytophthora infestans]|nr:hypothetical protein PInf_018468 [Phytophthora infestans]